MYILATGIRRDGSILNRICRLHLFNILHISIWYRCDLKRRIQLKRYTEVDVIPSKEEEDPQQ